MSFSVANLEIISRIFSHPTWDVLVVFFFVAFGFFYGISAGKKRLLAVLFSLYVSVLLFSHFSYLNFFVQGKTIFDVFLFRLVSFLVLVVLLSVLFSKRVFLGSDRTQRWWQIFVLSFLSVGLLMSAVFQLLPAKDLFTFSPLTKLLFTSDESFFWWLTLPLVALFFIVKKKTV